MNLAYLEEICQHWDGILVIGRTITHTDRRSHIIGMTKGEETCLYVIDPYEQAEQTRRSGKETHRKHLREKEEKICWLNCSEICIGTQTMRIQGGSAGALAFASPDGEEVQVLLEMMRAGWIVPKWLREVDFERLRLVQLRMEEGTVLPRYISDMPITIRHRKDTVRHLLEKTVTLSVGKTKRFIFMDHTGEQVTCYINRVLFVDLWKDAEERFADPRYRELVTEEQLEEVRQQYYETLAENCPKGSYYVVVEYECSKEIGLQFYSKEFLRSVPVGNRCSAMLVIWKPEQALGVHGLPLRGDVLEGPFAADTVKIPAEAFYYLEELPAWEETI